MVSIQLNRRIERPVNQMEVEVHKKMDLRFNMKVRLRLNEFSMLRC